MSFDNAIESHHEEVPMTGPISALVQSADAISGSRRGARGDTLESYIKRLKNYIYSTVLT